MLEEIGYEYEVKKVDLDKGEQFNPEFKKISPFSKIPVIIDHKTNQTVFESGAILIYLAEQSGKFYQEKKSFRDKSMVNGSNGLCWSNAGATPSISSL